MAAVGVCTYVIVAASCLVLECISISRQREMFLLCRARVYRLVFGAVLITDPSSFPKKDRRKLQAHPQHVDTSGIEPDPSRKQ